jgi:hypothetical protein
MATKETIPTVYVGELIRSEIKRQQVKNGFVITRLKDAGIEMSDTIFSNKIYGERDTFSESEVTEINKILGTSFKKD